MTQISGTLTVTDPGVTITQWKLSCLSADSLGNEEDLIIETSGSTPVEWSVNLYSATTPYMLVIRPAFDEWWRSNRVFDLGHLVMPQEKAGLFLYELTAINPVNNDPHWDQVMLRITGDSGLVDDKGHALTLGDSPPNWLSGTWNAPYDDTYTYLGGGVIEFNPGYYKGPITIDHADLNLGTGDFTLQFWVRDYYGSTRGTVFCYGVPGSGTELKLEGKRFEPLRLWLGMTQLLETTNFPSSTWECWQLARYAGSLYVIRNGTLLATLALAGEIQGPVYLGALPTEPQAVWTGHLFDFCVTKGVARHITSYTPWKLKSLGPQIAKSGATEPDWPETQNATVIDGAYTWTAKHRIVQPLIEGPIWPVEANG